MRCGGYAVFKKHYSRWRHPLLIFLRDHRCG
jgi:hypothetical protein